MEAVALRGGRIRPVVVEGLRVRRVVVAYPDEPVRAVLQRMAPRDISRIPVVDRRPPHRLLGVVERNDIVHAYELGTVRRGLLVSRLPGAPPGTLELQGIVPPEAPIVGKRLAQVSLPRDFLAFTCGVRVRPSYLTGIRCFAQGMCSPFWYPRRRPRPCGPTGSG